MIPLGCATHEKGGGVDRPVPMRRGIKVAISIIS